MKEALEARDWRVREAALGAAARLGLLDYRMLTDFLADPSTRVRQRAAALSGRVVPSGTEPGSDALALAEALCGLAGDDCCAEIAAFALGELGVTSPEVVGVLEHLGRDHDDPLCRESAIAALGALGVGVSTVLAATTDVATVRRRAVIALANFEGPDVEEALARALDDRDWQVRQAAEDLLG